MENTDIIEHLARDKTVEEIIKNVASKDNSKHHEFLDDLAQDIYMQLYEMDTDKLNGIYEKGQMNYYITRIVLNNINSKTSRYYYTYIKPIAFFEEIKDDRDRYTDD